MENKDKNLIEAYSNLYSLESDFRNRNLYELIIQRMRKSTIMDIGCGVGHLLNLSANKGFTVYGLEPNAELVTLGKNIYKKDFAIINDNIENVSRFKIKVDTITMIDVLEHIEHDELILKKLKNMLKPSGRIIVVVPAYQFLYGKRDRKLGHYRRYTINSLKERLEKSGYLVIEKRYWNVLGILPYFFYEKILKKEISLKTRRKNSHIYMKVLNKILFSWFEKVENPIHFGIGLSVLCVAVPLKKTP